MLIDLRRKRATGADEPDTGMAWKRADEQIAYGIYNVKQRHSTSRTNGVIPVMSSVTGNTNDVRPRALEASRLS